jgi:hypothetical protein
MTGDMGETPMPCLCVATGGTGVPPVGSDGHSYAAASVSEWGFCLPFFCSARDCWWSALSPTRWLVGSVVATSVSEWICLHSVTLAATT